MSKRPQAGLGNWSGFLPEKTVVMARRPASPVEIPAETESQPHTQPQPEAGASPSARLLVYLESEPSSSERELLARMMAAIGLGPADFVVEFGAFPEASCPWVLGFGLSERKSARLSALRPDPWVLPSLAEIQSDVARKKAAWEKLQGLRILMRGAL